MTCGGRRYDTGGNFDNHDMAKGNVKHTIIRNSNLFCTHCGGEYKLQFPIKVTGMDSFDEKVSQFNKLHADCKPTWKEPTVDQKLLIEEKALWWLQNGERGMSSEAMCFCLMGKPMGNVSHPYDPDDFKRCYKLLQAVPEWKDQLHRLKTLSPAWSKLVDNWGRLTEMYERNVKENWKNAKRVGMYEFMQTLIE